MTMDSMSLDEAAGDSQFAIGEFRDIYVEQVREIYPHGTTLRCARCGHTEPVAVVPLADIMRLGWPKHCGQEMGLGDPIADIIDEIEEEMPGE